jgi:D-tyrosyl-tRNA(Tyr) deacylase
MRALIQRVARGSVSVDGSMVGRVDAGMVILLGVTHDDTNREAKLLAAKAAGLRIFPDIAGKMNLSLLDVQGGALVVSQFTLYANARRGRRPDFIAAARPEQAALLCDAFAAALRASGVADVQTAIFGAHMQVEIHNDGPVTIMLDSAEL